MSDTFSPFTFTGTQSDLGSLNLSGLPSLNGSSSFPFLENQTGSAPVENSTSMINPFTGVGDLTGNLLGQQGVTDALGNTTNANASPMSQIFAAIDNFFQRAGFIALGIILIAIGTYFLARPQIDAGVRKVAKLAAA